MFSIGAAIKVNIDNTNCLVICQVARNLSLVSVCEFLHNFMMYLLFFYQHLQRHVENAG